ncbi:hypothetical protein BDN72DRAFT_849134 [Pluteus cervinus]|uniref:Uncharacterized protein n=1 Tax=Pluteus cervinus TaxID=181527 RepID=A0ACD3A9E3_9AGAR|nr:hypothetical protein BDN72DRAFT_849134 [Pluteus cervinus]
MNVDHSDILGQNTRPVVRVESRDEPVDLSLPIKIVLYISLFLVGYAILLRTWEGLRKWRERTYKLAMRRRHGIPDSDHRPFHIAFAAVARMRQENEAAKRHRSRSEQPSHIPEPRRIAPEQTLKHRGGPQRMEVAWGSGAPNGIPGRFQSSDLLQGSSTPLDHNANLSSVDPYNPILHSTRPVPPPNPAPVRIHPTNRLPRNYVITPTIPEVEMRPVQGAAVETIKGSYAGLARGSKRGMGDDDDNDDDDSKRAREKRARKVSLEKHPIALENMDIDVDEDDEYPEQSVNARGRKRDRAEAASTFGGDDEDSASDLDEDPNTRRRRRKRQTISKRKSEAAFASRGKKRDRAVEESESEGSETDVVPRVSRKKRGRKNSSPIDVDADDNSVSLDDSQSSVGGRRRRIGEEWESNGVRYKVGPNGQRLRQALVKKARQKFAMPQDSQHPDREANLEICIETWMTEDEYAEAKNQYLLAWQDSPHRLAEHSVGGSQLEPTSPSASSGKDLLWRSVISRASSMESATTPLHERPVYSIGKSQNHRDLIHQSVAGNVGLRINPFQKSQPFSNGKRVVSTRVGQVSLAPPSPVSTGLTDSTNASPRHRTFSKWEKQDLEAKAMMTMREITQKKEDEKRAKERAEKEKVEKEKAEKEKAAAASLAATKPATVLTFGPTAPTTATAAPSVAATPSFSLPALPSTTASRPTLSLGVPPTTTPASFPSSTVSAAKPADGPKFAFPSAPSATAAISTPTTATPFSLAPSTSGQPAANPFGEKKPDAAQASGGNLLSRLASQTAPAQAENKPSTTFSFGNSQPAGTAMAPPSTGTSAGNKFGFGTTANPAMAAPTAAAAPTFRTPPLAQTTAASSTAGPKFNFGLGPMTTNTATPSPSAAPAAQPTEAERYSFAGFGQPAEVKEKPATSSGFSLNFGQTKPAENAAHTTTLATPSITITPASTTPQPAEQPKTTFSFNTNSSQPSASTASSFSGFGPTKPAPSSQFAFGSGGPSTSDASKPATPAFGSNNKIEPIKPSLSFGAPTPTTTSGFTGFGTTPTAEAPKNTFGFGQMSAPTNQAAEVPKPSFSFTPSTPSSNGSFTFGAGVNAPKPGANGNTTAASSSFSFGTGMNPGNAFGSVATPTEAPKTPFAFGAPSTSNDAAKTTFGAPASSSNGAAPGSSGGFSFKFGENAKPAGSTTPFGAPVTPGTPSGPTPGAFGFNTPTSTTAPSTLFGGGANGSTTPAGTPTPFMFGAQPGQQQQ